MVESANPKDSAEILESLAPILSEELIEPALALAMRFLQRSTRARAAAAFVRDGEGPLLEVWAPDGHDPPPDLLPALRLAAQEALRPGQRAIPAGHVQAFLIGDHEGALGAICLAWPPDETPPDPSGARWIRAIAEILRCKVATHAELRRLRAQTDRDQRWFKTLDEQLRVLDLERQKFAAVVNQTDIFVFVTDDAKTIRWYNRAMAALFPSGRGSESWIGRECVDVCRQLGREVIDGACAVCPVSRALATNEVVHQEVRVTLPGEPGILYLTALPIKVPEGRPHEVMVLIQDLTGLETLRQSELRYRLLFERSADAILMADPATHRVLLANPAACRMLGYTPSEFAGLAVDALHPAREKDRLDAIYTPPPTTPSPPLEECVLCARSGEERIALVASARFALEGREVVLVQFVDITDRRRTELLLSESEARKGAMVEAALDAIVTVDHASRILEFNPAAERIFGYRRADVLGRDMAEMIMPESFRERHRRGMEHYLSTGEATVLGRRIELKALRADGTEFPIEIAITRISERPAPVFSAFIRDLGERKLAEEALRRAEERLKTVVATAPIVLFAIDRAGVLTLSEGKGLERLGLKPGEVVGQSVFDLYRDHPQVVANMSRGLLGEEFVSRVELGNIAYETWHAPLRDAAGEIVGMIGVATDITERKALEDQLRHAYKMEAIGRLAGGVAHDFNNLLTVICGHSELLMTRLGARDTVRRSAVEIHKAGTRGALLTRQLLAFSRKELLTLEILDLNTVVEGMEGMLRRLLGEDIQLVSRLGFEPCCIKADVGQTEQIVMNLAVNARDAMPDGGTVAIEVARRDLEGPPDAEFAVPAGHYVQLQVSDTGSGMDQDTLSHLFEPFFTTKEQGKGTGLGLSVVYGIVRQGDGDVRVESELGRGTIVRMVFPRVDAEAPSRPQIPLHGEVPGGKETVLLTEDEGAVRALAREMLEMSGYAVFEASSGEEALRIARQYPGPIHLAVTDVVMPGMSGVELVRQLVVLRPDLRVLLVSGYTNDTITRHGLADKGYSFLQKPYTLEDLTRTVRAILDAAPGAKLGG